MSKTFTITVEYDDEYEAADVLESVMGNIDIKNYESVGVKFKIPHWLNVERKEYLKKKGIKLEDE
jgi:hypothetical protein